MIKLEKVSKSFHDTLAVKTVSFEVKEGENLILLGTSGCGKTTTLKMINRLIAPDAGTVIINGKNIAQEDPELLRRGIGYVMQNNGLFPHYTVGENIAIVPQLLKWDQKRTFDRTKELMSKLHLPDEYINMFPHELSGGQQQRIGLARALVADPAVLLMDEPFGALDNVTRASIRKEFKALEELKRKTIVMVTHDIQEAFELADRICLMDKGEIIQIGTPKELLYKPASDFVIKFMESERLSLEFRVTTLDDLWHHLPVKNSGNATVVSSDLSVWDALNCLRSGVQKIAFSTDEIQVQKSIDINDLTLAFNRYQMQYQHE
ncbi:ATP-binding cassette domain-containing protein [Agrobacterium tumefaciens]|nr:ATP-binding cassette domain-containing protein [Agrobacterium tumefaciens]NTE18223.1 ATP-binding cassette domain-containing protein [Agrobacterium tumefaciens]